MGKRIKAAGGMRRTLLATSLASCFSLAAPVALAQSVPNNANLNDGAYTPINGTIWNLQGDAWIRDQIDLPALTENAGLTIQAGGGTIFVDAPGKHAFSSSNNVWIHTIGNVTFDGRNVANNLSRGSLIYNEAAAGNANIYLGTTGGDVTVMGFNTNPTASTANGGAIYTQFGAVVIGNDNGTVTLSGNTTNSVAAAVYTGDNNVDANTKPISIYGKTITIENNTAGFHSGAIYTRTGDITIGTASSDTVIVRGNKAGGSGGAIQAAGNKVTIDGKNIELTGNSVTGTGGTGADANSGSGGAIMGSMGVEIGNADSIVTITGNTAVGKGGAIYASNKGIDPITPGLGTVTIWGREITLSNNSAGSAATPAPGYIGGGAIYANAHINLIGDKITLSNNTAVKGSGGALEAERNITIIGSMRAEGNTAPGYGGAMWAGGNVSLDATTGNIEFYNNTAGGDGGAIRAGGNVTLNAINGDIIFKGNTASGKGDAIWFQNSYLSAPSNAIATFRADAGRTIIFHDSIANNVTPPLVGPPLLLTVNKTGAGAVVFDNADGEIYGTTTVQGGAFVVRNGAVYGVPINTGNSDTSFTVGAGATLAGGGYGEVITNEFTLQGTLDISGSSLGLPGHPAAGNASGGFSTFKLTSDSLTQFTSGSTVKFNTYLNDGTPGFTDLLVLDIDGRQTTGTAAVLVNSTGGGALTIGDGIKLVEANGTTDGAFALSNRLVGGPYEYKLYQGNPDGTQPDNWYLRSTLDCTLPQNAKICSGVGEPDIPDYTEKTSNYTALPPMALLYGLSQLDTLHERVGEEEDIRGRSDLHQRSPKTGGWGRVSGIHGKQKGHLLGIYKGSPKYEYDFFGFQIGQDLYRVEKDDGTRDHAGVYFSYGYADGNVTHVIDNKRGSNSFHAYTVGGYWTHFGKNGGYVDLLLQGSYFDMKSSVNSPEISALNTDAIGLGMSVETGKPYRFDKGYFIEPQAQLTYQAIDIDGANDAGGSVAFSKVDSLVGRIGARFGRTWPVEEERKMTFWIRPNVWHEFRGKTVTTFDSADGPVPFRAHLDGTWGEINIGGSRQTSRNTTLFLNGSYDRRFDGDGYSYNAKFGIRMNW